MGKWWKYHSPRGAPQARFSRARPKRPVFRGHELIKYLFYRYLCIMHGWGAPGARQWGAPGARQWGAPGARQWGAPGARQWGAPGARQWGAPGARQWGAPG